MTWAQMRLLETERMSSYVSSFLLNLLSVWDIWAVSLSFFGALLYPSDQPNPSQYWSRNVGEQSGFSISTHVMMNINFPTCSGSKSLSNNSPEIFPAAPCSGPWCADNKAPACSPVAHFYCWLRVLSREWTERTVGKPSSDSTHTSTGQ